MKSSSQDKQEKLEALLEKGKVTIHLDARKAGVQVPAYFKDHSNMILDFSYRFLPADLRVNTWGVRATSALGKVAIPWSAIFGMISHVVQKSWFFPEDTPEGLLDLEPSEERTATREEAKAKFAKMLSVSVEELENLTPSMAQQRMRKFLRDFNKPTSFQLVHSVEETEKSPPEKSEGEEKSNEGNETLAKREESGVSPDGKTPESAAKPKRPSYLRLLS